MNKYLVEIQYSGEELPQRDIIEAKDDDELIKKVYATKFCSYDDVEEYEKEEETKLDVATAMDEMQCSEDILLFIFNITKCEYVFEYEL